MASVGLSQPFYALYKDNGDGTVTYLKGGKISKAIESHLTLNGGKDNILYADNGPAESDNKFSGGLLKIITDALPLEDAAVILGITIEDVTLSGQSGATGKKLTFGDGQEIPYIGYGTIVKMVHNGKTRHMAFILRKIQLINPGDDYVTEGENITWGTSSLDATVLRDDTAKHEWRDWVLWETETQAAAYIKQVFNITDTPEG